MSNTLQAKMANEIIVDNRLSVGLDLGSALSANAHFLADPANRAHLADQLLLYERVAIPTKDFGIVPILLSWFGIKHFWKALDTGAFAFLHKPSLLGYVGNGVGIGGFVVQPSQERSFEWWQEAVFGETHKAAELQLRHMAPSILAKERAKLLAAILHNTRAVEYSDDDFDKKIIHETYTDVLQSEELKAIVTVYSGNPPSIDLTRLPGISANQMQVSSYRSVKSAIDVVLRIAEVNLSILMAHQFGAVDLYAPDGAERLLRSKLSRTGIAPSALDKFISLLDLTNVPNPGAAVNSGDITLQDIWRIRQSGLSRQFRKWLRNSEPGSARELERLYVASLGHNSIMESLPVRLIRFALTTAVGTSNPVLGVAVDVVDSFFVEKWLGGFTPKLFVDMLKSISGAQAIKENP